MDLMLLKIRPDGSASRAIGLIRQFDESLGVETIRRRMEQGEYVVGWDFECEHPLDEINGIDRKRLFRTLIAELMSVGAEVRVYQNEEEISLDILDNWLTSLAITKAQIEEHRSGL